MKRVLPIAALAVLATMSPAFAETSKEDIKLDKMLTKYVKRNIVKNPAVTLDKINILERKTHKDLKGWTILLTSMDLSFKKEKIHISETMFLKDGLITGNLINQKTGNNYRTEIKPTVHEDIYRADHLVFGRADAKHKILIFSDPQCPFCQDAVPEIFKAAQKNPEKIAIYYYHLPLVRIHPVSEILTKVMYLAQQKDRMDVFYKMYSLKIDPREKDVSKILASVEKFANFKVEESDLNTTDVLEAMKVDSTTASKMMVTGTPTIYVDGEWDKMRDGYKAL